VARKQKPGTWPGLNSQLTICSEPGLPVAGAPERLAPFEAFGGSRISLGCLGLTLCLSSLMSLHVGAGGRSSGDLAFGTHETQQHGPGGETPAGFQPSFAMLLACRE
jgi:hypothetical protein